MRDLVAGFSGKSCLLMLFSAVLVGLTVLDAAGLLGALAGVAFAVILVSMQIGFQSSMYDSAVRYHHVFQYDLVMLSPSTPFLGYPDSFSRRRLIQALAAEGVEAVTPVYLRQAQWKNPWDHNSRGLLVVGFDPSHDVLAIPGVQSHRHLLKLPDIALFDAKSRPEFGPVAQKYQIQGEIIAEVNDRQIHVPALFS